MPYCRRCGAILNEEEGTRFCANCGALLQPNERLDRLSEVHRKPTEGRSRRLKVLALATLVCFAVTAFGAVLPIDSSEASGGSQELGKVEQILDSMDTIYRVALIFGNNLMNSMVMLTPFLGPLYGSFVLFSTGRIIAALASTRGADPFTLLILTFIFPHAWIEYVSYGIALSESIWFAIMILKRRVREELTNVFKAISAVALLLLAAAVIETYLISLLS